MKLEQLRTQIKNSDDKVIAVAQADDHAVLQAIAAAVNDRLAQFILFGDKKGIEEKLKNDIGFSGFEKIDIIHTSTDQEAAEQAVRAISDGKADVLMKGLLPTAVLLKAVFNPEYGIRGGKTLSHIAVFDIPGYDRLIYVTDPAMNIAPDLMQKVDIINNAVDVAIAVGTDKPKVAVLAAVETVNSKMPATNDAALLSKMNERGQITNCLVDGPLALDNAISEEAARHKGITSDVAGQADILVVPTIEVGNTLYKSLIYFAKAKVGAIVTGAQAPIVLTSRSDTPENKLQSILLAVKASVRH
ncbi:phosphate butyryltransferase [Scopulibacillus darangshiensis]|uniref:Phosphate butyryltransferase n=1 Tax=Scopulibacillus darangshiensis TaxID=442528 RepID=A0A4R2PA48_9BACL|nr:phosphate butyryltransferase [Scopulibacillus darangshiensis]TCP31817.1 phosphate butyryltransferase [Scopulibacillus darangshiensis]